MKEKKIVEKGITLVALVITVIILLILSGITIGQLTGNGLLQKSKLASEDSKYATAVEKVALAVNASYDISGVLNDKELKENLNEIQGLYTPVTEVNYDLEVIVDGYKFKISKTGKITGEKTQVSTLPENTPNTNAGTEVRPEEGWESESVSYIKIVDGTEVTTLEKVSTIYAVSVGNGETVPIPKGFYYVGGTLESGVVISDNSRDRNKYVGIENVPDGAVYKEDGVAKRIIYNTDGIIKTNEFTSEEEKTAIVGNQFVWIPCKDKEYAKYDFGVSYGAWDSNTSEAELIQIQKYGGFYIGRYEAGTSEIMLKDGYTFVEPVGTANYGGHNNPNFLSDKVLSGKITCKAGEIPYFHSDYKTAFDMTKAMYNNNYVQSSLVTGTMWDMTIKFISDKSDFSDLKNTPWGNYNVDMSTIEGNNVDYLKGRYLSVNKESGIEIGAFTKADGNYSYGMRTTAWTEGSKRKNIYDLAGNLWEWTEELATDLSNSNYIFRGGSYPHRFGYASLYTLFKYKTWFIN